MLGQDGAAETLGDLAQFSGAPAARPDFVLEEALDFGGMRGRTAIFQDGSDVSGDVGRWFFYVSNPLSVYCTSVVSAVCNGKTNRSYIHSKIAVSKPTPAMTHHMPAG